MVPSATLWKYTFREVHRRPGRTLLTLLGIVIGVANVFAISATIQATRQAYREMYDAVGGRAALEIVAAGGGSFDEELADELRLDDVEGVEAAVKGIHTTAGLVRPGGTSGVLVLGIDPRQDPRARTYRLHDGEPLQEGQRGALVGRTFAEQHGLRVGSTITLNAARSVSLPVVGLLEPEGPALFNGGAVVVMPLPVARELSRKPGEITSVHVVLSVYPWALEAAPSAPAEVNTVQIVLSEGYQAADVRARLEQRLASNPRAGGLDVQTPAARGAIGHDGLAPHEQAFSTLSVVALVGGAFVILNSFLMNLTERRRQLAILRALGTTRGQLTRLLLREAFLLGAVGTVLGIALGHLLARGLLRIHEMFLGMELPPVRPSAWPYLLAVLMGPGMAVLATWWPARQAGRRAPLQAILPTAEKGEEPLRLWPRLVGLLAVGAALFFAVGVANEWWRVGISNALLPLAMTALLVGSVLFLPLLVAPLLPLAARLLRPVFGIEGAIAHRQLRRQPTRTSLTVGVLFIGVVVTVGFGNSLLNSIRDIDTWYGSTISSDFLVRTHMPDPGTLTAATVPESAGEEIATWDGVEEVGKITFAPVTVEGYGQCLLIARTVSPSRSISLALLEGDHDEVRDAMVRGELAIGSVLAQKLGKHRGDTVTLRIRGAPQEVRIAGVVKEYSAAGLAVYWDWEYANRALKLPGVNVYEVSADPARRDAVQARLQEYCGDHGLMLQTNRDLRNYIDGVVRAVNAFLWTLIALVFVIASMGIVNTLTMNVHEQTRELGVMRAVGVTRGQVRKLVLAQGVLIGLVGVGLGACFGMLVALVMHYSTYGLTGHVVEFHFQGAFLVVCSTVAFLIAVAAAVIPANRAARVEVLEALRYE